MQGDRDKSIDAGASDYITKPIDVEELLNCMGRWLTPAVQPATQSPARPTRHP
jgi:DNA-binding response OmpR family regulator